MRKGAIFVGVAGEKRERAIPFDLRSFLSDIPESEQNNICLYATRPTEGDWIYLPTVQRSANRLYWIVRPFDTEFTGEGTVRLVCYSEDSKKRRTNIKVGEVLPTFVGSPHR